MHEEHVNKALGTFLTGTAGAWFVAATEMDLDPTWSLAKKLVLVVVGGLLAGLTHQVGTKLSELAFASGAKLVARIRRKGR